MVSLSILQTHEPKNLRKFISEANKGIRAKISAEIKEERKKFSKEMAEKRKLEKEKRLIKIPKGAKKEDLIKVIMDNKKHFKDIKKNVSKDDKIKELDIEIKNETPKIKNMNSSELNELSKKYMNFKDLVGLDNKKHKGIVKAILKRQKELKKPNVPKITITEAEEETGGGAAYPKSKLGPIPKPRAKIRIVPKKPKAQLGQSGLGQKRKREEGPPKKKKVIDVPRKSPKAKVFSRGGKFFKPKEKKEEAGPAPKLTDTRKNQIIKKVQDLGKLKVQEKRKIADALELLALEEKMKQPIKEKKGKKPRAPEYELERIPLMIEAIKSARKRKDPALGLELQLQDLDKEFDLSEFNLPFGGAAEKPKAADKPKKKKKKETTIQRIRRERAESIERDKGKVIKEISEFPKTAQTEFFKYLKETNENGFTLEDQKDLLDNMEDLADKLPKERKARQELNQFEKEEMILFNALFPKEYIQYIEVENDITGRKEGIVAAQKKKADKEEKLAEKKRSQEALKIEKMMRKKEEAEAKQKIKDKKEFDAYMKKNPFKN